MKQSIEKIAYLLFLLVFFFFFSKSYGQISQGGLPASSLYNLNSEDLSEIILELNPVQLNEKSTRLGVYTPGEAVLAGFVVETALSPATAGKWEILDDSIHLWRQQIRMPGALGLGLNFDAFELSEGAKLFVYNPDKTIILGAFDHRNNNDKQVFSTQIIPGENVIIEYQEPYYPGKAERNEFGLLRLESLIYLGYGGGLGLFEAEEKSLGASGPCQVNINCPEGDNWQDQKRGVARILLRAGNNYFWCTGTLINNTAQDAAPLFLTAQHCGSSSSERDLLYWQFYFNFERPACSNIGSPPIHLIVGADLLSSAPIAGGSDFRLLMLRQTPPAHWRPYWNGWDRSNSASTSGVGIHHPSGDAKKISTYNAQLLSYNPNVSGQTMAVNSAWRVTWSQTAGGHGVVEGGSSGSPLFTAQGLVTGTLTGGSSSCDNPFAHDYYGKVWYHWDKNGPNNTQRLAPFLDPLNTGQETLQGFDPYAESFPVPGHISAKLTPEQNAFVEWYRPGTFPNPPGWYGYANNATHLSPSSPERAVFFEAPNFGLSYPLTISKVSHRFVEGSTTWSNNQFSFKIYDSNGLTLLHESPLLTASKTAWTEYTLPQPLTLNNYFYVAVRPNSANGTPTSGGQRVNYGQGYSLVGTSNNWSVPNYFPNFAGSLSYLTQIFVETGQNKSAETGIETHSEALGSSWDKGFPTLDYHAEELNFPSVTGYKLFRNNDLIHTATSSDPRSFTDAGVPEGLNFYHVTATYFGGESAPSARAYLLKAPSCNEIISQFPYTQIFQNNFDDACWLQFGDAAWQLVSSIQVGGTTISPAEGQRFFAMQTNSGSQTNQWLILPEINFSNLSQPALRFMFNGQSIQGPVLNVWVSKGTESFKKIWTSDMHPVFAGGNGLLQWLINTLNLKDYGNAEKVRIAFQVEGNGTGFFGIDKIELLNGSTITHNVNISINPPNSGTITGAGSYLSGQTVFVAANPNVGFVFNGWIQGGTLVGNNLNYSFVMPAADVNLTASFNSDPTTVPLREIPESSFELYPNPARDFISIRFKKSLPSATIRLYNAQAQLVAGFEPGNLQAGDEQRINIAGLPRGIYFIQVTTKNLARVLKVIITE